MKRYICKIVENPGRWLTIGGKELYARSKWEGNYARYLEFQKYHKLIKEWEHEADTFWFEKIKRGVRSYLPDFKVTHLDGSWHWVEVKGYLDPKSATKLKRMAKYYPYEVVVLIDKNWFAKNNAKLKMLIKDWE